MWKKNINFVLYRVPPGVIRAFRVIRIFRFFRIIRAIWIIWIIRIIRIIWAFRFLRSIRSKPKINKNNHHTINMAKKSSGELTPMMQQYYQFKAENPSCLILFRCGDFYETYGDDAEKASRILGITLTRRNNGFNRFRQINTY